MDVRSFLHKARNTDPFIADLALAVGLAVLVCLQIWLTHAVRPPRFPVPPDARVFRAPRDFGVLPYLLASVAFLPLALRRSIPWLSLTLAGFAAALYSLQHFPPAFTVLGPLIAMYSMAAYAKRRHTGLMVLLVIGLAVGVGAVAFSSSVRVVMATTGTLALFAAVALLGDTARNRREYIAEVEKRAFEAERTREEEALRRVEEERLRIAREVHDIVAHSLSIIAVQASAAETVLEKDAEQARESIRNIRMTSREALDDLRSMLDVLRTGEADAPLAPAAELTQLVQLVAPFSEAGIETSLRVDDRLDDIPAYASVSGYRIVQEALTNVLRHAGARHVDIEIALKGSELVIEVIDDGGVSASWGPDSAGHGIRGMRERTEALGGVFSAGPRSDAQGFRVCATIPLSRSGS